MQNPCNICNNNSRDKSTICIIEDVSDLWTLEKVGFYKGLYHVLGGSLSAIQGIGTDELRIEKVKINGTKRLSDSFILNFLPEYPNTKFNNEVLNKFTKD